MTRVRISIGQDTGVDSLRGQLLIASPAVHDPNFRRTVVLIAEHNEAGAMGVILNRPAQVTVAGAVPELEELAEHDDAVHLGGPVGESSVTVLAEFADLDAAAMLIDDDLGFLGSQADAHEHLADVVNRARVFAGHAGWEPGQLEAEMEEESWIVEPALREDVFTEDPEGLWSSLLRRKGGEYVVIATMPDDPTLN